MNFINKFYFDMFKTGLKALVLFASVGILFSIPLCLLWNWLMPNIFGLPTINVLEAFGLSALVAFLFPTNITDSLKKPKSKMKNENIPDLSNLQKDLEKELEDIKKLFNN
tara:strand:- start:247 stop:576 length:330 start_codon:yes stop_codon:yes gene_type:complete